MSVFHSILELTVKTELLPAVEIHLLAIDLTESLNTAPGIHTQFSPLTEFGSTVNIPQHTEGRIRDEPMFISREERFIFLTLKHFRTNFLKSFHQQPGLLVVHSLVIDLRKRIELLLECLVCFINLDASFRQGDELRMEGESGIRVVGVGVRPGTGHCRVIDWKDLDDTLPGLGSPIDKLFKVFELSDTETVFRLKREHRNRDTGSSPWSTLKDRLPFPYNLKGPFTGAKVEPPVLSSLPILWPARSVVYNNKLIFKRFRRIKIATPKRPLGSGPVQRHELRPVAKQCPAPSHRESLPSPHMGASHQKSEVPQGTPLRGGLPSENHVSESLRPERRVRGPVVPALPDLDTGDLP